MFPYIITVDGPSGSGKGTLAVQLARQLEFHILDSGAIYRLAALKALDSGVDLADEAAVVQAVEGMDISFQTGEELTIPFLDGSNVSERIRSEQAGRAASRIAAYPALRALLLQTQRDFFKPPGLVADGRDMGTTVFPDARIKIFLNASAEVRAERRYKQLKELGISANIAGLQREIEDRDERDRSRSASPMVPASDAVIVDSSMLSRDQVLELVLSHIAEVNDHRV